MKIKFNYPVRTEAVLDSLSKRQIWEFDAEEIFEIANIRWGDYRKTKTRPGIKGGKFRHCDLLLNDAKYPDYLSGIPESAFEVLD